MKNYWRHSILTVIIIGSLVMMMSFDPIAQNLSYHDFADTRSFFGIPNFMDVTSNLPFALVGLLGLVFSLKHRQEVAPRSWPLFFLGVTLVCFGSMYYHWNPGNDTLVWDRLPMTIGFMGLFVGLLSEYISPRIERWFLVPAIILGIASVFYWHATDDLRFYIWIQAVPLLTIPILLIAYRSKCAFQNYLLIALVCYLLAKVTEIYDREMFAGAYEQISGHSAKHLLAAMGTFSLYLFLKKRVRR